MEYESECDDEITYGTDALYCASRDLFHEGILAVLAIWIRKNELTQTIGTARVMPNGSSKLWNVKKSDLMEGRGLLTGVPRQLLRTKISSEIC